MAQREIVLCAPVRTAIGTYGGSLGGVAATELGATVIRATLARSGLAPERVDGVVVGQVLQAGAKMNRPRSTAASESMCPRRP